MPVYIIANCLLRALSPTTAPSLCRENTQTCMKSKLPKVFCERRLCSHLTFHHTWVQWTQASTHGNKYDRNLRGKATQKPEFVVLYWPLWGNYLLWSTPPPKGYQRSGTEELLWWNLNLSWLDFMITFLYYISSHWLPVKTSWNSQNNIGDMLWCIVLLVYGNYTGVILKCYVKLGSRGFLLGKASQQHHKNSHFNHMSSSM